MFRALVMLTLLAVAASARAQAPSPVTSDGFEKATAESTFYLPVLLDGVLGLENPGKAAHAALDAAAKSPYVDHAVFMIDSEQGWPLESEHIGIFQGELKITAVVRNALAPAIFPVFFSDEIFMTEQALIGGLPLHAYTPPGSKEVAAKQIGIYSSMLASAAQSRGHDSAIAYAMIDKNKKLYQWTDAGQVVLSNTKPSDAKKRKNFSKVENALPNSVLILDRDNAIKIGLAKPIADFDAALVGDALKKPNWRPANQFPRVAFEIGQLIDQLQPLRKQIEALDKEIPDLKNQKDHNSTQVRGFKQYKRNLDKSVQQLEDIVTALKKLYKTHPERHVYVQAPDGKTVLADPEQWKKDLLDTRKQLNFASGKIRNFTSGFSRIGGDPESLYETNQTINQINRHLRGIEKHGNAEYWKNHAKPDVPDDVYG